MSTRRRMVYEWSPTARYNNVDAQVAGERLEHLRKRAGGLLTAEAVVIDSRPEEAPLHPCFEWNDEVAAENYRREQARSVIQGVRVVMAEQGAEPKPVRAFVNVVEDDSRGYASTAYVMSNPELREQILQTAWRELDALKARYREIEELSEVFSTIDAVRERREAA